MGISANRRSSSPTSRRGMKSGLKMLWITDRLSREIRNIDWVEAALLMSHTREIDIDDRV